jgi:hypothetical protein
LAPLYKVLQFLLLNQSVLGFRLGKYHFNL